MNPAVFVVFVLFSWAAIRGNDVIPEAVGQHVHRLNLSHDEDGLVANS